MFDFIHAINEVLTERGIELPLPGQSTTTPENRAEKGLAVQTETIGSDVVERLYKSSPKDQMHIQHLLSANYFGDHLTRNGLDLRTRELLTFKISTLCSALSLRTRKTHSTAFATPATCRSKTSPSASATIWKRYWRTDRRFDLQISQ